MSASIDNPIYSENLTPQSTKLSPRSIGSGYGSDEEEDELALRVCSEANQGMRRYMEDELSIMVETESERRAFLAVYDGHGGKEAPCYARDNLYNNIKMQPKFESEDPEDVKEAIKDGFIKTHMDMFKAVESWPKRKDGHKSTSGTTVTVAIIRGRKLYVAHVGDSAAVLGEKIDNDFHSNDITEDHKPENPKEKARIENAGGRVATNSIPRVVWKRRRLDLHPPRDEYVPFLAVSRALGDLWSYDQERDLFVVSPEPDIFVTDLTDKHKFLILASDGVWGVMNGQKAVDIVTQFEMVSRKAPEKRNCAQELVQKTLGLWQTRRTRADNITAIVVFLDSEFSVLEHESDSSEDNEQHATTDVLDMDDEEYTPTLSSATLKVNESNPSLVRKLAFRRFDSNEGKLTVKTVTKAKFSPTSPPLVMSTSLDQVSKVISAPKDDPAINTPLQMMASSTESTSMEHTLKRKSADENNSCHLDEEPIGKKHCIGDAPQKEGEEPEDLSVSDVDASNLITKVSPESLKELQFDEDLGFADDESDESSCITNKVPMLSSAVLPSVSGL